MRATLELLLKHLTACQGETKAVVWANSAHAGDARPRFDARAVTIGFSTYAGSVTAAPGWGEPEERQRVVPARGDSYEYLFHAEDVPRFDLPLKPHPQAPAVTAASSRTHTHYQTSRLIERYDALYHFDVTRELDSI